jgi:hypothetical protein
MISIKFWCFCCFVEYEVMWMGMGVTKGIGIRNIYGSSGMFTVQVCLRNIPARRSYIIIVFFFLLFLAFYCQCSFGCLIGTNPNIFAASTEPNSYRGGSSTMPSGILSFCLLFTSVTLLHTPNNAAYVLQTRGHKLLWGRTIHGPVGGDAHMPGKGHRLYIYLLNGRAAFIVS